MDDVMADVQVRSYLTYPATLLFSPVSLPALVPLLSLIPLPSRSSTLQ